jgi:hypothetical protein
MAASMHGPAGPANAAARRIASRPGTCYKGGVLSGEGARAMIDWRIRGYELNTCNCNWGCPCQFNAPPTRGHCRAAVAMRIAEGHFGAVRLDGVTWAQILAWPGAIHEGRGEAHPIIDARASPEQVDALFRILKGEETEPGATIFNVFQAVIDKVHKPIFAPIELEHDMAARRGRLVVPGIVEALVEPIRNPVTGAPHFAAIRLHEGFEFREAEMASATFWSKGRIDQNHSKRYAAISYVTYGPHGIIAEESHPNARP